ncbi:MAG: methionyl-tRNA formyltransferase [Patescibacteria group bacterium]
MKLLFFGTSDFSKPVFEVLKKCDYSPILWNQQGSFDDFKKINPDICIVAAYGKIIPKDWLEIPRYGFLNIHPSLLPKYRGASPIQTAILNGDKESGITIILMDEKIDHGPILASRKFSIFNSNSATSRKRLGGTFDEHFKFSKYKELEKELAELGAQLLIETLPKWIAGGIKSKEQNHNQGTYTKKLSWEDGKIDWSKTAVEVERQIRALNPEPGTWTTWNNKVLKIIEAESIESKLAGEPGLVIKVESEVLVKCGVNALILKKVQLEGGKPLSIKDFLNGHRNFVGSKLT